MPKKPKTKTKSTKRPSAPATPRPPKGSYPRVLMLILGLFMLAAAPACDGDGGGEAKEAGICATTAALAAQHLIQLDCGLDDASLATDFAVACFLGSPTEDEAIDCLGDLYDLTECPSELPDSCTSFVVTGVLDALGDFLGDEHAGPPQERAQSTEVYPWGASAAASTCLNKGQPCYNPTTMRGSANCCGSLQCMAGIPGTPIWYCCGCIQNGQCLAVSQCP